MSGFRPLVVVGPSGVGKGSLIKKLLHKFPDSFGFCVSHTTRLPRSGEVDGVSYHFVPREKMEEMISNKQFLEHALVHSNMYGSSLASVLAVQKANKICVLEIDVQGAKQVHDAGLKARFLFISPPSVDVLRERLLGRASESDDSLNLRLKNAIGELDVGKTAGFFDERLVNDDLDETYKRLEKIVLNWYPHLKDQKKN
uniref:guanylate kinase n=1 Tax=Spongospora subterranea TaxID=70186 RepID=A0A0H5QFM0_9EUKA|eukprot:CRZ00838.1 hypothetical protein [Spongospora subterranea]